MNRKRLLLVFCALGGVACAVDSSDGIEDVDDTSNAIQGGELTSAFPAVGRVTFTLNGVIRACTGVLIGPNHVLTARHCDGENMSFALDRALSIEFPVDQKTLHLTRDQMVLQLQVPITTSSPIALNEGTVPAVGTWCTAVGRGRHDVPGGEAEYDKMRSALVRVTESSSASPIVVKWVTGLPAEGDSGGPLLCDNKIAGIFASGNSDHANYSTLDLAWVKKSMARAQGSAQLAVVAGATELAAYNAPGEGFQHVIAGTAAGELTELWFATRGAPVGRGSLPSFPAQVAIAGYFTPSDGFQHVISAASDGTIREQYWKPGVTVPKQGVLRNIPDAAAVAGYQTPDGDQHVIVVTSTGEQREIYWNVGTGLPVGSGPLSTVPLGLQPALRGIAGVAAYHAPSDGRQHVITLNRAGSVWETVFGTAAGMAQRDLVVLREFVAVTAYYSPLDRQQHVIVASAEGTLHEYRYTVYGDKPAHFIFGSVPNVKRLASYTAGDGFEHVIALDGNGKVIEVFAKP